MDIVNNMTDLCGRSAHRHVMLSTDELKLKYGNIVKKEHKVALNQLNQKIEQRPDQCRHHRAYLQTYCSPQQDQVIKRPEILSDLTGQSIEHLQLSHTPMLSACVCATVAQHICGIILCRHTHNSCTKGSGLGLLSTCR